jgi:hypothetical protein
MMAQVIHIFDAGMQMERKVVYSVVPGRKPSSIYYPSIDKAAPSGEKC